MRVRVKLGSSGVSVPCIARPLVLFELRLRASVCGATDLAITSVTLTADQSLPRLATGSLYRMLDADF
jgi:hypothetical protein